MELPLQRDTIKIRQNQRAY